MCRARLLLPLVAGLAFALVCGVVGQAQQLQQGALQSPILTIEPERLFAQSRFGQRVTAELEAEGAEIAAENRKIEAELIEEERSLTDRRASLPAAEFRVLANAFDEKVQRLRREQDSKARALGSKSDELQRRFLAASQPVLAAMMRDSGAALILERRAVFLSVDVIDITDQAIGRINAAIGDGQQLTRDLPPGDDLSGSGTVDNDAQAPAPDPAPGALPAPEPTD